MCWSVQQMLSEARHRQYAGRSLTLDLYAASTYCPFDLNPVLTNWAQSLSPLREPRVTTIRCGEFKLRRGSALLRELTLRSGRGNMCSLECRCRSLRRDFRDDLLRPPLTQNRAPKNRLANNSLPGRKVDAKIASLTLTYTKLYPKPRCIPSHPRKSRREAGGWQC